MQGPQVPLLMEIHAGILFGQARHCVPSLRIATIACAEAFGLIVLVEHDELVHFIVFVMNIMK
jgi:hypothetical protein